MSRIFTRTDDEIKALFLNLKSRQDVSNILEIDDKSLRYFLYVKRPEKQYRNFVIKKKNGSERQIYAPHNELKNIQRKLAYILNLVYEPKVCAYGFVKNKNILKNAENHVKKRLILNIDLKDFFTQIHFGRVKGVLQKKPYDIGKEAAITIAQIACYNGALPQGAPSSPILTNIVCRPLDNKLILLSKKYGLKYSRYADDITFSTNKNEFPKSIVNGEITSLKIGNELSEVLTKNSFTVNDNKVFLNSIKTRQEVTGIIVNKFPNVKREYIKNLRAIMHNCRKKGVYITAVDYINKGFCKNANLALNAYDPNSKDIIISWFKSVLKGKINFIGQVKGLDSFTFLTFAQQLNSIFGEPIFKIAFDDFRNRIEKSVVVIEHLSEDDMIQGSGFLVKDYGLFTNYHVTKSGKFFKVYRYSEYDDKFIGVISKEMGEVKSSKDIDYALYELKGQYDNCFELGDSSKINIGDQVTIIGYPNFQKGNSPMIQNCEITSTKDYLGSTFYTVGGRIVHGASGGLVLNQQKKIVGIVKGGVASMEEVDNNENQGFIPIQLVLDHLTS